MFCRTRQIINTNREASVGIFKRASRCYGPLSLFLQVHFWQEPKGVKKAATLLVCFSEPGKSQASCSILARDLVTTGGFLGIWAIIHLRLLFSLQYSNSVGFSFQALVIPVNPGQRSKYISTKGTARLPGGKIQCWKELCSCGNIFWFRDCVCTAPQRWPEALLEAQQTPQQIHQCCPIPKPSGIQLGISCECIQPHNTELTAYQTPGWPVFIYANVKRRVSFPRLSPGNPAEETQEAHDKPQWVFSWNQRAV